MMENIPAIECVCLVQDIVTTGNPVISWQDDVITDVKIIGLEISVKVCIQSPQLAHLYPK